MKAKKEAGLAPAEGQHPTQKGFVGRLLARIGTFLEAACEGDGVHPSASGCHFGICHDPSKAEREPKPARID